MELRDARSNPDFLTEARALSPLGTIPVWVRDEAGKPHVLGDSTIISRWLDRAIADRPRLWPIESAPAETALQVAALVDSILNTLIDTGTRYFALSSAPEWDSVRTTRMGRVEAMFGQLATIAAAKGATLGREEWSAAEMWLTTMILWLEGLPARAASYAPAGQIVSLGYTLPPALSRWADAHRNRSDLLALDRT